jgi:hypothetical protein
MGLLVVRAPAEAWGELRGTLGPLVRPDRLLRARRRRRAVRRAAVGPVRDRQVRKLLPPVSTPYRHGIEELAGIVSAGAAESRRLLPERAEPSSTVGGQESRGWRPGPGAVVLLMLTVAAAVAARAAVTGAVPGDALLPAPSSAADWWREYLASTHQVATGSSTTAPAYLLPLALVSTLLLGSARLVLGLLVLGAVPLGAAGGYRFLRRAGGTPVPSAWGAATYGLLLATGGALQQGRVGTLAAGILLPWLATSALGLFSPSADRRARAAWRSALWLALVAAFAPMAWVVAAVLTGVGVVVALIARSRRGSWSRRSCTPLLMLVPVPVAALLLLPWSALVWRDRGVAALLLEAGWPAPQLLTTPTALDVLGGRVVTQGAGPAWIGLAIPVAATLALLRRETRPRVLAAWAVALTALAGIWLLTGELVSRPGEPEDLRIWTGFLEVLLHGAWVTAAVVGVSGLAGSLAGRSFGWRQTVGGLAVALAVLTPVAGCLWWVVRGDGLSARAAPEATVPLYLDEAARQDPADGTLVLTGDLDAGLVTEVRRGGPTTLGQEAVLPSTDAQRPLTEAVADLVSGGSPGAVTTLAKLGVSSVLTGSPVDPALAERLDAAPGLEPASAGGTGGRAWRLEQEAALPAVSVDRPDWWRPALLGLQGVAVLVVAVLAAPSRRSR